ncbi:MAG TPA: M23 family metallopeptidase [Rhizomicrobium sp.]|jgi:murein DD-endopeptidase MepM/ murein hydrolase activator NlpD|nr:M23 family metallopeptidase [Rhizomicrobium sp.]
MRRRRSPEIGIAFGALMLTACAVASGTGAFAGESGAWPQPSFYTVVVRPGETLPGLAARYGVSAVAVASLNRVNMHRRLTVGEVLRIPAGSAATRQAVLDEALDRTAPNYAPPPKSFGAAGYVDTHQTQAANDSPSRKVTETTDSGTGSLSRRFAWPVRGPVISSFGPASDGQRNDGINIAAMLGAPIRAAASGTVTYVGDELKGYGNLILIAHPGGYITAYAHAQSISVARGAHVDRGQVIGTAGETGGVDRPQLHFEIREGIKPLNPVRLLAALP